MKERFFMASAFIGFLLVVGLIGGCESKYTRPVECTGYESAVYTFTDESGNNWEWEEEAGDNFKVGANYTLVMDDNHTASIYDDFIIKIKKSA